MGFDRSKFKGTSLATLREQQAQQDAVRPSNGGDRNYLKIEAGDNKFRIMPFHPDGGGSSYAEAKTTSFLSVETQKRDDNGKKIEGEKEVKRRPIFHAKVHGDFPYDLIDTYLDVAKKVAIPNLIGDDDKAFKSIWNKLTGKDGIKPQDVWVVYAMKAIGKNEDGTTVWGPIGLLELKKTMKVQLQDEAAKLSDGTQTPDPYSDPDTGIAIVINKSGKDLDTEYKVTLESQTVREGNRVMTEYVITPLADEQLKAFDKLEPLYKKYRNAFKYSDLEAQVDGLTRMETKLKADGYDINVFQYDEFVNVVQEMFDLVPEEKEEEEKEPVKEVAPQKTFTKKPTIGNGKAKVVAAPVVEVETEEEEEQEEEEVKEEVRPVSKSVKFVKKTVTEAAPAHIAKVDTNLKDILAKLKKK